MAVLGIDLGTQSSVLASIKQGTVCVVRNELADRLTPSLVLFQEGRRLMGDHAAPLVKSQHKACCRAFKNILGEVYSESTRVQRERDFQLAEIAMAEAGDAGFLIAETSLQRSISEVVIACPTWFRQANRAALLAAAEIAGLKCLRVISEMAATALDYGLYRRQHFAASQPQIVAFVDVGHSASSVCVARFSSEGCEILAEMANAELGGRDLDRLIMFHFAQVFKKAHGFNPLEGVKARLKMEETAERVKKVLSANSETIFAVECLANDIDFSASISRELFEGLCEEHFKPALLDLLQKTLAFAGVEASAVSAVEVVGGCTRIPFIQRCVSEVFGREVSRTLAGDECVARGCALQAAMASLHFKVKEFGFVQKTLHPISLNFSGDNPVMFEGGYVSMGGEGELVLPAGLAFNSAWKVTFRRRGGMTLDLNAFYRDLPQGLRTASLGGCRVQVPPSDTEVEVQMLFELDANGFLQFSKAFLKEGLPAEGQSEKTFQEIANSTPGLSAEENCGEEATNTEKGEAGLASAAVSSSIPSVRLTEISVTAVPPPGTYTPMEFLAYREAELAMDNEDRVFREKQERLNALEALVYRLRAELEEGTGSLFQFVKMEEAAALRSAVDAAENWVYDHQDDPSLSKSAICEEIAKLEALAQRPEWRKRQQEERRLASDALRLTAEECRKVASGASTEYSHIERQSLEQLLQHAEAEEAWLSQRLEEQQARPSNEDPCVSAKEISQRHSDLVSLLKKVISTPKPAAPSPKVPPPASSDADGMDMESQQNRHGEFSPETQAPQSNNSQDDSEFVDAESESVH